MTAISILQALGRSSRITRFVPYMLDDALQVEKHLPGCDRPNISKYNMDDFATDNQFVKAWFFWLQQEFIQHRNQHDSKTDRIIKPELAGSRSFNASYMESDLECAIVSENFDDFLDFCRYLHARYHRDNRFIALKTVAGMPLLIIKGKTGFRCPELSRLYPGKTLPQLEITFRQPDVHQIIQGTGMSFFSGLTPDELASYIFNKRYIELMLRNLPEDALFEGGSLKGFLNEFKAALVEPLTCLPPGLLQDAPDFSDAVFADAIKHRPMTSSFSFFGHQLSSEDIAKQQQAWLQLLSRETARHCAYLTSIGWADRAVHFKVKPFVYQDMIPGSMNIGQLTERMAIPDIVNEFNPQELNTLFVHTDSTDMDQTNEINRALDIRLYPTIKTLIKRHGATVFTGLKTGLQAYTKSVRERLVIEIEVPSSVTFYIALNHVGALKIYIAGLVSHENLIQQLMTLKLAGIDLNNVPVLGNTQHYKRLCQQDLLTFEEQSAAYMAKRNVLIVAGCGLEETVCATLDQMFAGTIIRRKFFTSLTSLTYVQSEHAPNLGFLVLNLNYGEICEEQIAFILEKFHCMGVFSGSAAGYIPGAMPRPDIGSRVPVHSTQHYSGDVVVLDGDNQNVHWHVPSIFVETFDWLQKAKASGVTTVDVETFYIARAVQTYLQANPHARLHMDIGVFISDYVGEKPLRNYADVFVQYPLVLQNFVQQVLVANITSSYNNNRSSMPDFSTHYFGIHPEPTTIGPETTREAVVDSIGKRWDKSEFSKRVHTPVTIGVERNKESFSSQAVPRCIHLPIKLPGSDVRIPAEYQHFSSVFQQIFDFEVSVNDGWNDLYAYLTVDQGIVPHSNSQRVPGPHVDGIPRDRDNPEAQLVDHAYLVTNEIPTMFYTQQFDMRAFDPKIHHFFAIFRALCDESRTITVKPFDIILMNAYSVHTPTQAQEDVHRTFVRVEFSTLEFDRVNNSINPYFSRDDAYPNYPFSYVPRPIPKHLFVPPEVFLNKPVTHEDYLPVPIDVFGRANLRAIFMQNDRYKRRLSDYNNLEMIAEQIMAKETCGAVVAHQGIPHAFFLYKIENKTIKLDTLFTLTNGRSQELMVYMMKRLEQMADHLAKQAGLQEGATPVVIVINDNNEKLLKYFLRAARLAKLEVQLERSEPELSTSHMAPKMLAKL